MEAVMTSLKRHGSTLLWGCILAFLVATRAQMEAVRETLHYPSSIDGEDLMIASTLILPFALQLLPLTILAAFTLRFIWNWSLDRIREVRSAWSGPQTRT